MIRPPPRTTRTDTLFPYTTLFRSSHSGFQGHRLGRALMGLLDDFNRPNEGPPPSASWTNLTGVGQDVSMSVQIGEHTSELQSLMRISYAGFCLKKKKTKKHNNNNHNTLTYNSLTTEQFTILL